MSSSFYNQVAITALGDSGQQIELPSAIASNKLRILAIFSSSLHVIYSSWYVGFMSNEQDLGNCVGLDQNLGCVPPCGVVHGCGNHQTVPACKGKFHDHHVEIAQQIICIDQVKIFNAISKDVTINDILKMTLLVNFHIVKGETVQISV